MARSALIMLVLLLLQILVVGVLVPSDFIERQIQNERSMAESWLGQGVAEHVDQRTEAAYTTTLVETGIIQGVHNHLTVDERERGQSDGHSLEGVAETVFPYTESRLEVLWATLYQSFYRAHMILTWIPYLLPIWIPVIWQGVINRRIKQVSYGYASANRYHLSFMAVLLLLALIPFYLFAPVAVPPAFIPAWGMVLAAVMLVLITHFQKMI